VSQRSTEKSRLQGERAQDESRDPSGPSPFSLKIGKDRFDLSSRILVIGILNRTPDSFYDKGRYFSLDAALARVEEMIYEGADIVDVGGQKAGPGEPVSPQEEIDRVCPVIEHIASDGRAIASVDTFVVSVAEAALDSGAHIVNDISGLADPQIAELVAEKDASLVITHIKGRPRVANPHPHYGDVVAEVADFLLDRAGYASDRGVDVGRIILDAGLDLGKTASHSLALLAATPTLVSLGYPLLVSASNKPFIGESLGLEIDERLHPTLAAISFAVARGARLVRVHDVAQTKAGMRMLEAILES
jgi:dihydropteroate synthase